MERASTPTQHRTKGGADRYAVLLGFEMRGSRHTVPGQHTAAEPPATPRFLYTKGKSSSCWCGVYSNSIHQ